MDMEKGKKTFEVYLFPATCAASEAAVSFKSSRGLNLSFSLWSKSSGNFLFEYLDWKEGKRLSEIKKVKTHIHLTHTHTHAQQSKGKSIYWLRISTSHSLSRLGHPSRPDCCRAAAIVFTTLAVTFRNKNTPKINRLEIVSKCFGDCMRCWENEGWHTPLEAQGRLSWSQHIDARRELWVESSSDVITFVNFWEEEKVQWQGGREGGEGGSPC